MTPSAADEGRWRLSLVDVLRTGLLAVVLAAVAATLWRNWPAVSSELSKVPISRLGLAFVLSVMAPLFTLLSWRRILADLGTRLHVASAASMFFVGQLGKYVPGSVWTIVAQMEIGARLGIPRRRTSATGLVAIGLGVLGGVFIGLPAVSPLLFPDSGHYRWWVLLLLVPTLMLLWPGLLNSVLGGGMRMIRREPLEHPLSLSGVLEGTWWVLCAWVCAGLAVLVLVLAVKPDALSAQSSQGVPLWVLVISGTALASVLGVLSVFVPAGVGVREGMLALILTPVTGAPAALAVVILARFLTLLADILVASFGWIWGRTHHLLGGARGYDVVNQADASGSG